MKRSSNIDRGVFALLVASSSEDQRGKKHPQTRAWGDAKQENQAED